MDRHNLAAVDRDVRKVLIVASLWLAAAVLVAILIAAQSSPSPYSVITPGGVYELAPIVQLPDEIRRDTGWLAITSVRIRPASFGEWLLARFDPAASIVPRTEVRPDGVTERDYTAVRRRWLESSKRVATVVALQRAGYPVDVAGRGLLVERLLPETFATELLQVGDVILRVEGEPVTTVAELTPQLRERGIGAEVELEFLRDNRRRTATVTTVESSTEPGRPIIGVRASPFYFDVDLPFPVELTTERILGSSGGLMLALGIYDALTEGDLAGGRRVAGTGMLDIEGRVGSIGSVAEKVAGAERERADVFLTPRQNAEAANRAARSVKVVAVESFDEALAALREIGGGIEEAAPAR